MDQQDVPEGCKIIFSKYKKDISNDASENILSEDVTTLQKCLKANNGN